MSDETKTPEPTKAADPTATPPTPGRVLLFFNPKWHNPAVPFPGTVVRVLPAEPDGSVRVSALVLCDDSNNCTPGAHHWPTVPVYDAGVVPPGDGPYATWPRAA